MDSLPAEPPGMPQNTGVGSLSLLKWIFLTQESNQGLLHSRWILYQLSYQGSQFLYISRDILKDDNFASTVEVELFIDEARNRTARLDKISVVL